MARVLNNLGSVAWAQADCRRAAALCEEALALFRDAGEAQGSAYALSA